MARILLAPFLAGSAAALHTLGHASASDVHDNVQADQNTLWRHTDPNSNSSWKLYEKYNMPNAWKLMRLFRGKEEIPRGDNEVMPVGKEYFGERLQMFSASSKCNFRLLRAVTPSEGYVVADVKKPNLLPFPVPVNASGRTDTAVIVVPGSGGEQVAWESEGTDFAVWLNSMGISAFVLKHRVPDVAWGDVPSVMDLQRAVTLVKYAAPTLGINASRVGVIVSSHAAAMALRASSAIKRLYDKIDKADGKASFRPDFLVMLSPGLPWEFYMPTRVQSYVFNKTLLPPMMIAASEEDACVPSDTMLDQWNLLPTSRTELHLYPRGKHSPGLCLRGTMEAAMSVEACRWVDRMKEFVERHVWGTAQDAALERYAALRKLLLPRQV
mmetsp:Transcript_19153/g.60242  ORF Transcript_19153/g.60242 Transcript_19153/m.60242 type:complete len:383 (-) Transcript_19153:116-1264(-)|eukprot:CAMPEP_0204576288 /NCGR_PEP_ID=MMETSP0661-20131031/41685_1 /ASSEMBLY_ACC=CAM_ASM_000606 /TAXON_ID=109239 /ORGANISM="Alexandrium margalefi, Strain AMGDE01CS-322" /LENGTH=382 /DNA_ID=CAMNT_0051585023 /DNA_START=63 /DNA_END=1211 /DNA_ORIENTATION=+